MNRHARRWRAIALGVLTTVAALAAGAAAFVYSGIYDLSATDQHTPAVYWLIELQVRRSVQVRAAQTRTPDLTRPETIENGFRHYDALCVQCHGAPGVAPGAAALGMTPVPKYLTPTAREWSAAEIHWVVRNGLKMSGMPAWKYRMSDEQIWEVVAFVKQRLPALSAQDYRALIARSADAKGAWTSSAPPSTQPTLGSPAAGRRALEQYACATCHAIPDITGATRDVGPPLRGIATRAYIAGVLPNTRENMVRWIMSPQSVSPVTAMPDLRVREGDARDIAAFLATLTEP